jgi:O-antigen ligase
MRADREISWQVALLHTIVCACLMIGIGWLTALDLQAAQSSRRGIEDGLSLTLPALVQPRFGVNVTLDHYTEQQEMEALQMLHDLSFATIRQRIPWATIEPEPGDLRWERWDRLMALVRESGLRMVAVLDTSPAWARPPWEANNPLAPPTHPETMADFAGEVARRYGDIITAYQIWDQPNISPHWGTVGPIDPGGYVELLRLTAGAIREADPAALIIAGGLAPNTEPGGRNMSDILFLREMYLRGAGEWFDILGVQAFGFWTGPDDRRVDPQVLNFSRVILLREEMHRRGEAHKPVWALNGGWCALPPDWAGLPPPQGSDLMAVQAHRLERALMRIEHEWPWMTHVFMQQLWPDAPADDPVWGLALISREGRATELLDPFARRLTGQPVVHPGLTLDAERLLRSLNGADGLFLWGTDLHIGFEPGAAKGVLYVAVEGLASDDPLRLFEQRHRPALPAIDLEALKEAQGRALIWAPAAMSMAPDQHLVRLYANPEQLPAIRALRVGHRSEPWGALRSLLVGGMALILLGAHGWGAARRVPWHRPWWWARERWAGLPEMAQAAALGAAFLAVILPPMPWRLLGLVSYGLIASFRPDHALLLAVAVIPLAPLHVRLDPGSFSLSEIGVLAALAAHVWVALLPRQGDPPMHRASRARFGLLDAAVLALVILGLGTSLVAEYQRVALREFRVVVLEPAILYLLLRLWLTDRRRLSTAVDVLWVSAVGVALFALLRYPQAEGVIVAEGVRRARAFYGSPNNLALYLGRMLPLGLAMAWAGSTRRRRWLYGLGILPVAGSLLLTFSRGSWLLGIPAALLTLVVLRGGRLRWILALIVPVIVVVLLSLTPLAHTERLASLLQPGQGTLLLRLQLWQASLDMARDHPWLGVGLDNFLYYYGDYVRPGAEVDRWLSHPHNLVLDFWLRLGIGGLVILAALFVGIVHKAWQAHLWLPEGDLRAAYQGLIAGVVVGVAHGMIDSSFFVAELAYWLLFALAWINQATSIPLEGHSDDSVSNAPSPL